jgi:formate dehydrogenase subunit beta
MSDDGTTAGMHLAWATTDELRDNGECGGAVTALMQFALESARVNAAVATVARGGNRYDGVPVLITDAADLSATSGALHSTPVNLARFLKEYLDGAKDMRIAVACKPCDAKAIIELAKREQIDRSNLLLVGLNCTGTFSPAAAKAMFEEEFGVCPDDVVREDIEDGRLTIWLQDGREIQKSLSELEGNGYGRRDNCRRCETSIPVMADLACGKWGVNAGRKATFVEVLTRQGADLVQESIQAGRIEVEDPDEAAVRSRRAKATAAKDLALSWQERDFSPFREMSLQDRFAYWQAEFSQCIKCFGCRDACPICYCKVCWLEAERGYVEGGEIPPSLMWPMVRVVHVMDSCVNCGQCQDACSMNLPLSRLIFMLNRDVSKVMGYEPGMDLGAMPPCVAVTDAEAHIESVSLDLR